MDRPEITEFAPYYSHYVSLLEGKDVIAELSEQPSMLRALFNGTAEERGRYSYEDGKWTIKELLSHIIDGERIFAYRILRISRGDETPIEGFEQDGYIATSNASHRSFTDLLDEFDLQRQSNMILLRNLSDEAGRRTGTASGYAVSVRALVYVMAGHVSHHINILNERYLA